MFKSFCRLRRLTARPSIGFRFYATESAIPATPIPQPEPISSSLELLKVAFKKRDTKEANILFDELKLKSSLDVASYKTLISLFVKTRDFEKTMFYFNELRSSELISDDKAYGFLVNRFLTQHYFKMAETLYFNEKKSNKFVPTLLSYNSLMKACARNENAKKVEFYFNEMKLKNIEADKFTYNCLIACYRKNIKKVRFYLNEMKSNNFEADVFTYNVLIYYYRKNYNVEKVEFYLNEMKSKQIAPNSLTYENLIRLSIDKLDKKKLEFYFNEMTENGVKQHAKFKGFLKRFGNKIKKLKFPESCEKLVN